MTATLEKAFKKASRLSAPLQEQLAKQLLGDLAGEAAWDATLSNSQDLLASLAARAVRAHKAGKTISKGFDEL